MSQTKDKEGPQLQVDHQTVVALYFQQFCSIALYHHQADGAKECYSSSIVLFVFFCLY